jgi:hydrogenase expression/formation protein HypD
MKFIDEFRDANLVKKLAAKIASISTKPVRLMEFCGGHTVSIMRNGIRQILPSTIDMLSGPGCPVCVTSNKDIDTAIAAAFIPGAIITTFGDMLKVPGSLSSLQKARAEGGDIRVVYSTQDALQIARDNPDRPIVFIGVGFETTAPTIAASIIQAENERLENYHILCRLKLTPPAIKALLELGEIKLNGIICPGHVCAIIGSHPFELYAQDYGIACVVAGFEPLDILQAVEMLVQQVENGKPRVDIAYTRGVKPEGNFMALELMQNVFDVTGAEWRGLGTVPGSGLTFKDKYKRFSADEVFDIKVLPTKEAAGCRCAEVLRGIIRPSECKLFRSVCSPEKPVGPCMVSSEGTCSAYYNYGDIDG